MPRQVRSAEPLKLPFTAPFTDGLTETGMSTRPNRSCRNAAMGCSRAVSATSRSPNGIAIARAGLLKVTLNANVRARASATPGRRASMRRREVGRKVGLDARQTVMKSPCALARLF